MATKLLGNFQKDATVPIMWSTNDQSGGSITRSTDGTFNIYKGSSATQRTSSAGIVDTEDFDSLTGVHQLTIDTSDNTDAGFYEDGEIYHVVLVGSVIDSQTVNEALGSFILGQMVGASTTALSNASVVAIVNKALIMIGEEPISSITEDTKSARLANAVYAGVRDSVFESHVWKSTLKLATLAKLTTVPDWGFTAIFQLPSDFIRLMALNDQDIERQAFQIQGREFYTSEATVEIIYVARITDPNDMSPLLRDTISAALALYLAMPITGDKDIWDRMEKTLAGTIAAARHSDALQRQDDQISTETFLQAREGGGDIYRPIA